MRSASRLQWGQTTETGALDLGAARSKGIRQNSQLVAVAALAQPQPGHGRVPGGAAFGSCGRPVVAMARWSRIIVFPVKVSAVCPACGRPASSKGRSVCLYCGAPLTPVATGKVSAAGSGRPIEVEEAHVKAPAAPPPPPRPRPGWMDVHDDRGPVARLLSRSWVRAALVVAVILFMIFWIGKAIDDHRPPGYSDSGAWR